MEKILESYEKVCSNFPNIYKVENCGNYLEVKTEIYFKWANEYLNLYIIPEENGICLSDSNNVYRISDDFYDVDEDILNVYSKFNDFISSLGIDIKQ